MNRIIPTLINSHWTLNLPQHRAEKPEWYFWEKERLAAMYAAIRPGDLIIDVGAEQGDLSALFAQWAGESGGIILIEPAQGFWPNIKLTFEANELKPPIKSYVGFANWEPIASAPLWRGWPDIATNGEIVPETGFKHINEKDGSSIRLDAVADHVDIITIDVEGSEYEVLMGAERLLCQERPTVFVSVHPEFMWREHRHSSDDLIVMMKQWGFEPTYLGFDHEQHYMFKPLPQAGEVKNV